MVARERQRDKQQGIVTRRLSWPTVVLASGGPADGLGRIVAAVPPG
jgi:hypothetical protein